MSPTTPWHFLYLRETQANVLRGHRPPQKSSHEKNLRRQQSRIRSRRRRRRSRSTDNLVLGFWLKLYASVKTISWCLIPHNSLAGLFCTQHNRLSRGSVLMKRHLNLKLELVHSSFGAAFYDLSYSIAQEKNWSSFVHLFVTCFTAT